MAKVSFILALLPFTRTHRIQHAASLDGLAEALKHGAGVLLAHPRERRVELVAAGCRAAAAAPSSSSASGHCAKWRSEVN